MNARQWLLSVAVGCLIIGKAIVKRCPDPNIWWVGSVMEDVGTALMGSILLRDKRNIRNPMTK